jgi:hypothetical protein
MKKNSKNHVLGKKRKSKQNAYGVVVSSISSHSSKKK